MSPHFPPGFSILVLISFLLMNVVYSDCFSFAAYSSCIHSSIPGGKTTARLASRCLRFCKDSNKRLATTFSARSRGYSGHFSRSVFTVFSKSSCSWIESRNSFNPGQAIAGMASRLFERLSTFWCHVVIFVFLSLVTLLLLYRCTNSRVYSQ